MWKEQIKRTGTAINRGGTGVKEQQTTHTRIEVLGSVWVDREARKRATSVSAGTLSDESR
jgi:hypothetical protein